MTPERGEQGAFEFAPNANPGPDVIYVASALSHLSDEDRELVRPWCDAISEAVVSATLDDSPTWELRPWVPLTWSAPGSSHSPEQIYEQNMRFVRDAAALIILGFRGGSLGAGQELAWATAARIPILHLRCRGEAISRQIIGTPADITFCEFESTDDIREAVIGFVRARRHSIEDHARRLRNRRDVLASFAQAIRETWVGLDEAGRRAVAANSRLHPRRAAELASDPLVIASAAMNELLAFTGALGIDPWRFLSGSVPELQSRQIASLKSAAQEFEWTADESLQLYLDARMEMARGGVRRFRLVTAEDWVQFKESRRRD